MNKIGLKTKQEEVVSLISEKASSLVLEQAKALLNSKVNKMEVELNFVRDRLVKINAKRDETSNSIRKIEPDVVESGNIMNKYKHEKEDLENKCKQLKDVMEKMKIIEERKEIIKEDLEIVTKLHDKKNELQRKYKDVAHTREIKEEKFKQKTEQCNGLEEDIRTLKGKIQTYTSITSEFRTIDELKSELVRAKNDIKTYSSQAAKNEEELKKIESNITRLKPEAERKVSEKDKLLSQKQELQEKISELAALEDKDSLKEEVNDINGRNENLSSEIKSRALENESLEARLAQVGDKIKKEEEFKNNASARLEEMTAQKKEIDNIEHVIKMINLNIEVNKKFREMIEPAAQYLAPINKKVESMMNDYKKEINKLSRVIQKNPGNI